MLQASYGCAVRMCSCPVCAAWQHRVLRMHPQISVLCRTSTRFWCRPIMCHAAPTTHTTLTQTLSFGATPAPTSASCSDRAIRLSLSQVLQLQGIRSVRIVQSMQVRESEAAAAACSLSKREHVGSLTGSIGLEPVKSEMPAARDTASPADGQMRAWTVTIMHAQICASELRCDAL